MNRLLEMGLISEDDFQGLMRANATTSPIKLIKRPHQTRLPPDQVLAILGHCKDTLSNNVQDSIRDLVAAILDQEKYASLDDMRREIEAKLGVDMQLHLDWLQDTVERHRIEVFGANLAVGLSSQQAKAQENQ
ncbi:unnamed protein product [Aphanomyces euteiches]